jgi:hypothetical protein
MTEMALVVFVSFTGIAAMHVAWGLGSHFPAENERDLVALVVGRTGRTRMPDLSESMLAATIMFSAGMVTLALADLVHGPAPELVTALGALATTLVAGRAVAAYVPAWRRSFAQEPFASMDRDWYAPFWSLVALALFLMVLKRAWS